MAYYHQDQLSLHTRSLLADYFADLILITQSLQSFRQALTTTQHFNPIQLFRYLDKTQKGYLTPQDFSLLISDNVKKILHYAFGWFDISKSGQITKNQFISFLTPRVNHHPHHPITTPTLQQPTPQQIFTSLPMQLDLLRSLLLQLMQKQTKLIPIRRLLLSQQDYTLKAVMNALDIEQKGYITTDDFYKFIKNYNIDINTTNIQPLFNIYNKSINGKITINQLSWLVQGLQNNNSYYRNIVRNSDRLVCKKRLNSCCTCKNLLKNNSKKNIYQSQQKLARNKSKKYQNTSKKVNTSKKLNTSKKQNTHKKKNHHPKSIISTTPFPALQNQKHPQKQPIPKTTSPPKKIPPHPAPSLPKNHPTPTPISKLSPNYQQLQYLQLKKAIHLLQQQTQQIDLQLQKHQYQIHQRTQLQYQKSLSLIKYHKNVKLQQQHQLQQRLQQLQTLHRQQQIQQKQSTIIHLKQHQQNILRQLQLQKNKISHQKHLLKQTQLSRIRQVQSRLKQQQQLQKQRLLELQQISIKQQQIKKQLQLQQQKLSSIKLLRLNQQIQHQNNIRQLETHLFHRQIKSLSNIPQITFHTPDQDLYPEPRLKTLLDEQARLSSLSAQKYLKQNQYFQRYSNYCHHLAQVVDPLSIKQHLIQTDKYLAKSKQFRTQIKQDRVTSLNKFPPSLISNQLHNINYSKINNFIQQKTPQQFKYLNNSNQNTTQSKFGWSNH